MCHDIVLQAHCRRDLYETRRYLYLFNIICDHGDNNVHVIDVRINLLNLVIGQQITLALRYGWQFGMIRRIQRTLARRWSRYRSCSLCRKWWGKKSCDSAGFVLEVSSSRYLLGLAFVLPKTGITIAYMSVSTICKSMYASLEALGRCKIH